MSMELIGLETITGADNLRSLKGRTVVCTAGIFKGYEGTVEKVQFVTDPAPTKANAFQRKLKSVRGITIRVGEEYPNGSLQWYTLYYQHDGKPFIGSGDIDGDGCGYYKRGYWMVKPQA